MRRPRTLAGRLFAWQMTVVLLALAGTGIVLDRVLENEAVDILTRSLVAQAVTVQNALPDDPAAVADEVERLGDAGEVRITVVRADGVVLADSERDPATLENHRTRPEVAKALEGEIGTDSRVSESTGIPHRYVALPQRDGLIVRVALPLTTVEQRRRTMRAALVAGVLSTAAAAAAASLLVARHVARPVRRASESLSKIGAGDLGARVEPADGPEELAALTTAVNRMAEQLEQQVGATAEERRARDLILSSMDEGILLAGPDRSVRFANTELERLLGGRPADTSTLAPLGLREAVQRAAAGRSATSVEVETGAPARFLRGAAIPVGEDGSVLLVLRDVTEAKRLEAVRRDFVVNASHELKTPAASIQAAAETIRTATKDDPEVVPRFAEQLEREALRLSRIVSDLLDLSRLEGGSELEGPVALDAVVRDEVERLEGAAREAGVELVTDLRPVPPVRGSARDLALMVRNLVDNAIRYTRPGGRVEVGTAEADGRVLLHVADTGIGIPSRDLPRVFERFYRVDRARSRETGGTGLGLSIVRHVAENHGGAVEVTSELGRGTRFEVLLPAAG